MGRIGAHLSGFELKLLNRLSEANSALTLSSLRLATGKKINSAKDDPTGLIALSGFQSRLKTVQTSLSNVTAASSMVSQVQLVLDQVRTQLSTIRAKAIEDQDQGLTASQRAANQAAIDDAIQQINRLVSTDVNGRRLLDGSADFTISGLNNAEVFQLDVISLGPASSETISGEVTTAAERAELTHTEATGSITNDATFTLSGNRGSVSISVVDGESLSTVADRINLESHLTGVTARVAGNDLQLESIAFGTAASVSVEVTSGTFAVTGGDGNGTATGTDAEATINGQEVTGDGNRFSLYQNGFQFSIEFEAGFAAVFDTITVSGQPLTFALTPDLAQRATLAIPGLQASRLGGLSGMLDQLLTGGSLAGLGTNAPTAVRVVDEALARLTLIEGRVDGFADSTIGSSEALLDDLETKLLESIDSIDQVNEDEETLLQSKNEQLISNSLSALAILNSQRQSVLQIIEKIAGLS